MSSTSISIKRCHGLGNVVLLLPVLDYLHNRGFRVNLVTRKEWVSTFSTLRPKCKVTTQKDRNTIDLDSLTADVSPSQHRIDEFAQLLGIEESLPSPQINVPAEWQKCFKQFAGSIIFAPEAAHPSRSWPLENCRRIKSLLPNKTFVLVGTKQNSKISCDVDLRGQLDLKELFGVISVSSVVITMDSAVLHIAAAVRTPTVAIFGGVCSRFRVRKEQPVVIIQSKMACCPCNKNEICEGRYDCIRGITIEDIRKAVNYAVKLENLHNLYLGKDIL